MFDGFNTPDVKKAYRKLSRTYHPDRTRKLSEEEQTEAKAKFLEITRAHETLTNKEKFDNWIQWGNPEGSLMAQSINVALPSWLMEPENQIYVMLGFFFIFVCIPMAIISRTKEENKTHENGIDRRSDELMMHYLLDMVEGNMKKKKKAIDKQAKAYDDLMKKSGDNPQGAFDAAQSQLNDIKAKLEALSV